MDIIYNQKFEAVCRKKKRSDPAPLLKISLRSAPLLVLKAENNHTYYSNVCFVQLKSYTLT